MTKFTPQFEPLVKEEYAEAVKQQILSGWLGPAKATLLFESRIRGITGSKYCVSTTSGTAAIMLALGSLNLPPGATILFPSYTFLAGANAAKYLGYKVKLVDIKEDTLSMNPDLVDLTDIDAVIFVNHNGYVGSDVQVIADMCQSARVPLIEDSSQGLGIHLAGRTGDLGILSFSVPKLVTTGQGGAAITDDILLYEKCRQIRDHGDNWRKSKIHTNLGVNFKFNDILASYGLAQLNILDQLLEERKRVFTAYRKHLRVLDHGYESAWMVIYHSKNPDKVISALKAEKIQAVRYYKPINHNSIFKDEHTYPCAEKVSKEFLYLPSSLVLDSKQIDNICNIVKKAEV